ncbi:unnamed protein product [Acanthoscelides obtectus]|uniref:Uncharacterized protein n=1 Tax=Acanthoscelides obtectus TaxID=200917 RepID=A0A9P0KPZ2_ACAOB|nr:unnamed protein product [Acanthoscelides obtectus]CAK1661965.1 hypothetical protein AOBTE_LOCUS22902 [Acanthoscelides obtectus]
MGTTERGRYGRLNVLRWLLWEGERCADEMPALDHRPPPDSGGGHGGAATTLALHYAAARGCLDCVKLLVDSTPDLSALYCSVLLFLRGANIVCRNIRNAVNVLRDNSTVKGNI